MTPLLIFKENEHVTLDMDIFEYTQEPKYFTHNCTFHPDVTKFYIQRLKQPLDKPKLIANCFKENRKIKEINVIDTDGVLETYSRKSAKSFKPSTEYDVDIFIPYHRNIDLVIQTVDSILAQNGTKNFIHLVNDQSPENDQPLFQRYGHLKNIKWYKTKYNCGPYAIANSLFHYMKTNLIAIIDSDDIYLPNHIALGATELDQYDADIWCSNMIQFLNPLQEHSDRNKTTAKRNPVIKSGIILKSIKFPRVINATMIIRRSTFEALNGFNGKFFCGADTEFTQRAQHPNKVKPKIRFNNTVTAMRRLCSNSLSNSDAKFGYQSKQRKEILDEIAKRYIFWDSQGEIDPTIYGTLKSQENVLTPVKPVNTRSSKVYACITTIPRRIYALELAVNSLLPQVDGLKIHLNDFDHVPDFLKNPKIELILGTNELMSCTKFMWSDKVDGYVLTCDDDFIYPPDYVDTMIEAINKHKCWVCCHGSKLDDGPIENYYKNRKVYVSYQEVLEDTTIDVPGTGLSGYHTDDIKVSLEDINLPGMEDIAAFIHTYNHSYRVVAIAHPKGWLKVATNSDDVGLWEIARLDGSKETKYINDTRG